MSAGGLNLERILVAFLWVGRVSHWERTVASYRSQTILVIGAEQSSQGFNALIVRTLGAIRNQHGYVKTWGKGRSDLEVSMTCAAW